MNKATQQGAILALDQGTTSSRAIVFNHAGGTIARAQREFSQHFPKPGHVEHDATEIWQTQLQVAADAVIKAQQSGYTISAIGIANQRETTVLWDRATGQPLAPAIVWQDRRTADFCDALTASGHQDLIEKKTGLIIDAYFSATKLKWLLDNTPTARARAAKGEIAFGTVDSWLIWNLSGGKIHASDVSNASRTMLFNIHTLDWDDDLLTLFDIPPSVLPQVIDSSGIAAVTDCAACAELPAGIPIAGIAGDQQAALFGQACHQAGMAKNTYGTGCFMLMNTGEKPVASRNRLLTTVAWRIKNKTHYALEGSVFMGGATIQWLRDGLGIIAQSSDVEELALSVPDNGGVTLVAAFAGLGAPYWDPNARGTILGLTRGSTKAHIARAALESIAFQSADLAAAMALDANIALTELRVDGGASSNNTLMQFQADLLGIAVVRPKITETTALGAAYLAGLAVGFWQSEAEIAAHWAKDRIFMPTMSPSEVAARNEIWHAGVECTRTNA